MPATDNTIQTRKPRRRLARWLLAVVVCAVVVVACVCGYRAIGEGLKEQGASSIRSTIIDAAEQCYAIEGAYPASLDYLKNHYGLSVNERDYTVTYVVFAANVQPTVTVVAK